MKLRNKKTGEIGYFCFANWNEPVLIIMDDNGVQLAKYNSLAELNDCWEDAPDEYWCISCCGDVDNEVDEGTEVDKACKEIGNYFNTREEAEKAVEKLKAIQRLKNYYLKFKLDFVMNKIDFTYRLDGTLHSSVDEERIIFEDMNLLFGGEE